MAAANQGNRSGRDSLESLTRRDLVRRAAELGIRGRTRMRKAELIRAIVRAEETPRPTSPAPASSRRKTGSRTPGTAAETRGKAAPEALRTPQTPPGPEHGERFLEPQPYETTTEPPAEPGAVREPEGGIHLLARDPDWLFAWWEYRPGQAKAAREAARRGRLQLRLHRFENGRWTEVFRTAVPENARNWYIRAGTPDAGFEAEIGYEDDRGVFRLLGRSRRVTTPRAAPGAEEEPRFVTIPFDLPFAQLLEYVRRYMPGRRDLARALYELQELGTEAPFPRAPAPSWSERQRGAMHSTLPREAGEPGSRVSASGRPFSSRGLRDR